MGLRINDDKQDERPFVNANGEHLIGYEEKSDGIRLFFRNREDATEIVEKLRTLGDEELSQVTVESILKSNCRSSPWGGCVGDCSVFPAICLDWSFPIKGGKFFGCACR